MGFSFGGETAPLFCAQEPRCLAAIALDGGSFLLLRNLTKPTLTINRSAPGDANSNAGIFDNTFAPAIWFQISNTAHGDLIDYSWVGVPRPSAQTLARQREATWTINAYMLWFLNKYVKGINDPMPPLANYPRVINFRQK
jgi:hypothetical protein